MLARRLRRRSNIETTLGQRLMFAGVISQQTKCWASTADDSPTLNQHWVNAS